jgi:dihydrofolate reductase
MERSVAMTPTRKVISLMHISLDGFAAGPNGELEWTIVTDDMYTDVAASLTNVDTALYGRVTYQMMESYWPGVPGDPASTANELHHADWYAQVRKIVGSRTLERASGDDRRLVSGDIAGDVARLKREPGGDMMIFGSPSIVHALARHDLVDEYRIMVNPVLLGSGTPLFAQAETRTNLELLDARIFDTGVVRLHYRTRTDGGNQ